MHHLCRLLRLSPILSFLWSPVLADSFLSNTLVRKDPLQSVLEHEPVKVSECKNIPPTGPIDATLCDYETIEAVNGDLFHNLHELVQTPFFKYFQVDLYRECPFWDDNGSCNNPGCAITTVDESEIPPRWRAKALSEVDGMIDDQHRLPGCYYRDSDFCFLDDNTEGDYYDLTQVPERFTGYSGPDAHRIWRSIYEENCFGMSELNLMTGSSPAPVSLPESMMDALREDGSVNNDQCLEKRVYYKVISGLHASISTHICMEYLNQTTGEWGPNLGCFVNRVASHPERLQYIYFNVVLMLRAVSRLGPYLSAYDYCSTGNHEDELETKIKLANVINLAQDAGRFDETVLFRGENANILREEFKQHFRNVTRIMDCVGCDKCRLWGKIQTTGLATALKILFEMDEKALDPSTNHNLLQRSEVVALMNTLHRLSESLEGVNRFRKMWSEIDSSETEHFKQEAQKVVSGQPTTLEAPPPIELTGSLQMRVQSMVKLCTESTTDCLEMVLKMWRKGMRTLGSVFRPSGKENGPGAFMYEEL
ncbi:endoplasmic oxidoreductin-1 [Marasmius sp. AFHP31]|nr:endoplasmic oxidoreductin-1 [Marasmius sp. AFHP31]